MEKHIPARGKGCLQKLVRILRMPVWQPACTYNVSFCCTFLFVLTFSLVFFFLFSCCCCCCSAPWFLIIMYVRTMYVHTTTYKLEQYMYMYVIWQHYDYRYELLFPLINDLFQLPYVSERVHLCVCVSVRLSLLYVSLCLCPEHMYHIPVQ